MEQINKRSVDITILTDTQLKNEGADLLVIDGKTLSEFSTEVLSGEFVNDQIRTPTPISPLSGTSGVALAPTLSASVYAPLYTADVRDYRRFEITLVEDENFTTPIFTAEVNADSVLVSPNLPTDSNFIWRCKDVSVNGIESAWMESQSFATSAVIVKVPVLTVEGTPTSVPEGPFITTSAFDTTPAGQDIHVSTDWEVRRASDNVLVYSSYDDLINLTSLEIPLGVLLENVQYKFRARHTGEVFGNSAYGERLGTTLDVFPFDRYLAVTYATTPPNINIYGQDVDTFNNLSNLPAVPSGFGCSFSRDGVYFAVAHSNSPTISVYKRNGDEFNQISVPATGALNGNNCAFSPSGTYLAVAHSDSPSGTGISLYKRNNDTFTKISIPTIPTANGCNFSADENYLAAAHATTPFITIYKRSGDTFTKLNNPTVLPTSTAENCVFSSDGTYLAVAHATTPFITIYKRSGDTFTKLNNPTILPTGNAQGCAFSPDGRYLSVVSSTSGYLRIYKRSGDIFTNLNDIDVIPPGNSRETAFSSDGVHLSVVSDNTPFITIYKRIGDVFTKLANPAVLPLAFSRGTAFFPRAFEGVQVGPFSVAALQPTGSFSTATQETTPQAVSFHSDGTKMFVIGSDSDSVHEYALSTAWDVTTATFSVSFSVSNKETTPTGMAFRPDGTKFYVAGSDSDAVHEYTMSTPWSIATATFTNSFAVGAQETATMGVAFRTNGTKMYIVGAATDSVHEYTLSTPWDITTAVFANSFNVDAQDVTPVGINFNPSGTKMYIAGDGNDSVYEYNLSIPWNITSSSFLQQYNISSQTLTPKDILARTDNGTKFYVVGSSSVYQYDALPRI